MTDVQLRVLVAVCDLTMMQRVDDRKGSREIWVTAKELHLHHPVGSCRRRRECDIERILRVLDYSGMVVMRQVAVAAYGYYPTDRGLYHVGLRRTVI